MCAVTKLKCVRCQNSRRMPELPTIGTLDPHGIWKLVIGLWPSISDTSSMTTTVNSPSQLSVRCWNFRPLSELPTHVGTPDPHGIWKLAVGLWPSISDTSGMTTTVNSPSQLSTIRRNSQPLSELLNIGTPDPHRNSQWTNPRSTILSLLGKYQTRPVLPDQQKSVSSFISQTL